MPSLKVKATAKRISPAQMRARIEKGNYKALKFAGRDVWQAVKRGIGQGDTKPTKAGQKAVKAGELIEFANGLYRDITMLGRGKPRSAGKPIKSWSPKRFYYNSILTFWDGGRKSVVIGPYRGAKLANLHQFGGTLQLTAYRTGARDAYNAKQARDAGKPLGRVPLIIWSHKRPRNARNWDKTTITKSARYPARPFMRGSAGVEKVIERIRLRFRDTLPIGGRAA
jgi:hypothetical protein